MDDSEEYLDCDLYGVKESGTKDGFGYWVHVFPSTAKNEEDFLFAEYTFVSGTAMAVLFGSRENPTAFEKIMDDTFSKAKARLALNLYEIGNSYEQDISSNDLNDIRKPPNDIYIQEMVLRGLYNLRRNNPQTYNFAITFEVEGFCNILAIEKKDFLFSIGFLIEEGLVKNNNGESFDSEEGDIHITAEGVKEVLKLKNVEKEKNIVINELTNEGRYDIALSFAGEDRNIAERIANLLREKSVRVFYDKFEEADLWGKNLYDHLSDIYTNKATFTIILISKHYKSKNWTNLERKSAQARAFRENREYILPLRLDETQIPGLAETVGYLKYEEERLNYIIDSVLQKLSSIYQG